MWHQPNRAEETLRVHALKLPTVADGLGAGGELPVGTGIPKQDGASIQFSDSGAPQQLVIMASIACAVLLGSIGVASAADLTYSSSTPIGLAAARKTAASVRVLARVGEVPAESAVVGDEYAQGVRAFQTLDLNNREMHWLREVLKLEYRFISRRIESTTPGAVRVAYHRARQRLADARQIEEG